jgi:hypothetical protein
MIGHVKVRCKDVSTEWSIYYNLEGRTYAEVEQRAVTMYKRQHRNELERITAPVVEVKAYRGDAKSVYRSLTRTARHDT